MTEVTCATDLFAIYFDSFTTLFFNSYDEAKSMRESLGCGGIITRTTRTEQRELQMANQKFTELPECSVNSITTQTSWTHLVCKHPDLCGELQIILLNKALSPFRYELDIDGVLVPYDSIFELEMSRRLGTDVYIVLLEDTNNRILINGLEQLAICQCEKAVMYDDPYFQPYSKVKDIEQCYLEATETGDQKKRTKTALDLIDLMSEPEFYDRLNQGYLPEFQREIQLVQRSIAHYPTIKEFKQMVLFELVCTKYKMRDSLRFYSVEEFKNMYHHLQDI
jgi:hypothetical protein